MTDHMTNREALAEELFGRRQLLAAVQAGSFATQCPPSYRHLPLREAARECLRETDHCIDVLLIDIMGLRDRLETRWTGQDAIAALQQVLPTQELTFGYIGNVCRQYDDRSWRIWLVGLQTTTEMGFRQDAHVSLPANPPSLCKEWVPILRMVMITWDRVVPRETHNHA